MRWIIGIDEAGRAALPRRASPRTKYIVGIDEAGRGPLAGPVTVAAVALQIKPTREIQMPSRDSKHLSEQKREAVYHQLTSTPHIRWAVASVGPSFIDRVGIVRAVDRALVEVLRKLSPESSSRNSLIFLDGSLFAPSAYRQCTVIKGDESVGIIAAASIIAKVHRDRIMLRLHARHPLYGFDAHKGYGTRFHYDRLAQFGPSPLHRRTYLAKMH